MEKNLIILVAFFILFFTALSTNSTSVCEGESSLLDNLTVSFFCINDNLICPYEAAINGWSVGPDDQYTNILGLHIIYKSWMLKIDNIFITSRLNGYRFDLLKTSLAYTFLLPFAACKAELGVINKGNFGGEFIQNSWHKNVISYPVVELPYTDYASGVIAAGGLHLDLFSFFKDSMQIFGFGDLDLYFGTGPSTIQSGLELRFASQYVDMNSILGCEYHFLLSENLDSLMDNGFFGSIIFTLKPVSWFGITIGFGLFPVGDVNDDPNFKEKDYPVIPQIWYLLTFGKESPKIRDYPHP